MNSNLINNKMIIKFKKNEYKSHFIIFLLKLVNSLNHSILVDEKTSYETIYVLNYYYFIKQRNNK